MKGRHGSLSGIAWGLAGSHQCADDRHYINSHRPITPVVASRRHGPRIFGANTVATVANNTVYAAAGTAHCDGTYLVAVDAITGQLKAFNDSSGSLVANVNSGISIRGNLRFEEGELRFLGGGVCGTARNDLKALKCLNPLHTKPASKYRTAFYPYDPDYGKYISLEYQCDDGCVLIHDGRYEGIAFSKLALERPLKSGEKKPPTDAANDYLRRRRRGKVANRNTWNEAADLRFTGFVVGKMNLIAAGHAGTDIRTAESSSLWKTAKS